MLIITRKISRCVSENVDMNCEIGSSGTIVFAYPSKSKLITCNLNPNRVRLIVLYRFGIYYNNIVMSVYDNCIVLLCHAGRRTLFV